MARVVQVQLFMSDDALKAAQVCGIDIGQVAGDAVHREIREQCARISALDGITRAAARAGKPWEAR